MARAYNATLAMRAFLRISLATCAGLAALTLTVSAVFVGGYYYVEPSLPHAEELREVQLQIPLRVYSRDGRLISTFGLRRTPVLYRQIPEILIQAVLAAEDDAFFEHPGLDYAGTARAAITVLTTGGSLDIPGGSTITQQVAREYFLTRDVTLVRKFKELLIAFRIESEFTKEEILELYLNTYFFGQQSYGVVAAARTYFDKELDELTLSEVAIIAGIPQGPSIMNPFNSPERAATRRSYVLGRLLELGRISDEQYQRALTEPILGSRFGPQRELEAAYVAEMVRIEMLDVFGIDAYSVGLKVTTTIDSRLQSAANRAIRQTLITYDESHGYRGPMAQVELSSQSVGPFDGEARWSALLADYPDPTGFETGLVLGADEIEALIYVRGQGQHTLGLDSVEWAATYINDDVKGDRPTDVAEVLQAGDIVRLRRNRDGSLRLAQLPDAQGAFVALDPQDAAVSSLAGGFDFFLSNFNRATQTLRQPGSAFKPFVYSAALENGFTTATIVNDAPISIYDPVLETYWKPENYSGLSHGETRLREALVESYNQVSVRVVREVGVGNTVRHLRKFGFDEVALQANLSLALGAGGIAPINLAAGYATLANGGFGVTPYLIQRIEDADGIVLYEAAPVVACTSCEANELEEAAAIADSGPQLVDKLTDLYPDIRRAKRVVSAQNAYLVGDMMRDVVRRGTGNRAQRELRRNDLAGKTGTSNDRRDAWFTGFNGDIVATAWVGFDEDRSLGGNAQGGVTAIPMWIEFMAEALDGLPEHVVERPPGIIDVRINPQNGKVASDATREVIFEKFRIGHEPERERDPVFAGAPNQEAPAEDVTAPAEQSIF